MIRVVMLGRTGNNLFQYAAGRALAERHGVPLVMDGSWFNRDGWCSVSALRDLPIKAKLVRDPTPASRLLRKLSGKHRWEYLGLPVYREKEEDVSFDPSVLNLTEDCVLHGYFQTPLYFRHLEPQIREELSFTHRILDGESRRIADSLAGGNSVAVHVRRSDYIGNPNADLCGPTYYRNAISRIRDETAGVSFHIFSDDTEWCRRHFTGPDITVAECSASRADPINDIHLMSLAQHHIIANSSYSWWAAWLGKKAGQRVLMPEEWFRGIVSPISEKKCDGWETVSG